MEVVDEFFLSCLEQQQQHLEQKLHSEIKNREASHCKLQSQIDGMKFNFHGMKSNLQQQMQGMNEKFDPINDVLVSIQLQILNLQSQSQKFAPLPQNLAKPFSAQPKPTPEAITTSICVMKLPNNPESHHIFHGNHEKKMEDEDSVLIKNLIGTSKQELQYAAVTEHTHIDESNEVPDPTSVDIQMPKIQKSEEVPDNPEDLVPNLIGQLLEAPKPHEQIFKLGPNSMGKLSDTHRMASLKQKLDSITLSGRDMNVLFETDLESESLFCLGLFQEKSMTLRWACFVIDRGRRAKSQGCVKKTMVKLGGGPEEAWSCGLRMVGRYRSYSRRTMKEQSWSFLVGVAVATNEKGKGIRCWTCRPLGYEKNQNNGREKAQIRRIPVCNGRSDAWSRRIAQRGDRRKGPEVRLNSDLWEEGKNGRSFIFEKRHNSGREVARSRWISKHGGRPEVWSRRIVKAQGSPASNFEGSRSRFTSVVMDDSGNRKRVENWADNILMTYGLISSDTLVILLGCASFYCIWTESKYNLRWALSRSGKWQIKNKITFAGMPYLNLGWVAAIRKLKNRANYCQLT